MADKQSSKLGTLQRKTCLMAQRSRKSFGTLSEAKNLSVFSCQRRDNLGLQLKVEIMMLIRSTVWQPSSNYECLTLLHPSQTRVDRGAYLQVTEIKHQSFEYQLYLSVVIHTYIPGIQDAESGESQVQGHLSIEYFLCLCLSLSQKKRMKYTQ